MIRHVNTCLHLWKLQLEGSYVGNLLYWNGQTWLKCTHLSASPSDWHSSFFLWFLTWEGQNATIFRETFSFESVFCFMWVFLKKVDALDFKEREHGSGRRLQGRVLDELPEYPSSLRVPWLWPFLAEVLPKRSNFATYTGLCAVSLTVVLELRVS